MYKNSGLEAQSMRLDKSLSKNKGIWSKGGLLLSMHFSDLKIAWASVCFSVHVTGF